MNFIEEKEANRNRKIIFAFKLIMKRRKKNLISISNLSGNLIKYELFFFSFFF